MKTPEKHDAIKYALPHSEETFHMETSNEDV